MQAVSHQVVNFVYIDGPGKHAVQYPRTLLQMGSLKQLHDFDGLNRPIIAQQVGNFVIEHKSVGKLLVGRYVFEGDIFDRVAKWPVPQIVQQRGNQE